MRKVQSKKNGSVGTKNKGVMAMAKAVAEKVKRSHEKGKSKKIRQQPPESDDELNEMNEPQETEEESGEEKSDAGDRSGEISSDLEINCWKIGLRSKTKIGKWIPSTNKRNSSVGESRLQRKPTKPSSPS